MCTPGGEVAFISKLIDESINLQGRVRWYSSMLGKLSSVSTLLGKLKDHDIENYALTEFTQGNTKRWGLAWSFLPMRPREVLPHASKANKDVSCPVALSLRPHLPKNPKYVISAPLSASFTIPIVQRFVTSLHLSTYAWEGDIGIGAVTGNVWSRSVRRNPPTPSTEIKLAFRITVTDTNDTSTVTIEWRIGTDIILFESFCGKIKQVITQSSFPT
jgi:23S rRNA (adenine1618-N6)-methyltransferase